MSSLRLKEENRGDGAPKFRDLDGGDLGYIFHFDRN